MSDIKTMAAAFRETADNLLQLADRMDPPEDTPEPFEWKGDGVYLMRNGEEVVVDYNPCRTTYLLRSGRLSWTMEGKFYITGHDSSRDLIRCVRPLSQADETPGEPEAEPFQWKGPGVYLLRDGTEEPIKESRYHFVSANGKKSGIPYPNWFKQNGRWSTFEASPYDLIRYLRPLPFTTISENGPGWYRLRNGKAIKVLLREPDLSGDYEWIALSMDGTVLLRRDNGRSNRSGTTCLDIIEYIGQERPAE